MTPIIAYYANHDENLVLNSIIKHDKSNNEKTKFKLKLIDIIMMKKKYLINYRHTAQRHRGRIIEDILISSIT